MNFEVVSRQLLSHICSYGGTIRCDDGSLHCNTKENFTWYTTMFVVSKEREANSFVSVYDGANSSRAIDEFIGIVGAERATHLALNWFKDKKEKQFIIDV